MRAFYLMLLGVFAAFANPAWCQAPPQAPLADSNTTLTALSPRIDVHDGKKLWKGQWRLKEQPEPQLLTINVDRSERRRVCFISGENSLCREVSPGSTYKFEVLYMGRRYPHRLVGRYVRQTSYNADYIRRNRGTQQFLVPESYELANIILSLTEYGRTNQNRIYQETPYYRTVQAHFGRYRDHPLIARLNLRGDTDFSRFIGFRENAAYWTFAGGKLVQPGPYYNHWNKLDDNHFARNVELVEDFAKRSGFRAFYKRHRPYYESLKADFLSAAPLADMVGWLERSFGAGVQYDSYKVVFSPLVAYSHTAFAEETPAYRELLMFVGAPHIFGTGDLAEAEVARMIFTELDHGFVNPLTDRFTQQVAAAMSKLCYWNDRDRSGGYGTPVETFNEYMTWAAFSLWAREKYPKHDFGRLVRLNRYDMIERGFPQFPFFDRMLLDAFGRSAAYSTIAEAYPAILSRTAERQKDASDCD